MEFNCSFNENLKISLMEKLFEKKELPEFPYDIDKITYLDGVKMYFKDGGWISARFSGTEPLIRIFCEMDTMEKSQNAIYLFRRFLGI